MLSTLHASIVVFGYWLFFKDFKNSSLSILIHFYFSLSSPKILTHIAALVLHSSALQLYLSWIHHIYPLFWHTYTSWSELQNERWTYFLRTWIFWYIQSGFHLPVVRCQLKCIWNKSTFCILLLKVHSMFADGVQ